MKESHDVFKQWQDRFFVLDCQQKTITYYTEAQKINEKGKYSFTSTSTCESSKVDASVATVANLFVVTGKTAKGGEKSELFMSATSPELKFKWVTSINKAIKVRMHSLYFLPRIKIN